MSQRSEKTPRQSSGGMFGGRGHGHGIGMPTEKAKDFKGTFRRLVQYMRPHRWVFLIVTLMAALSTVFGIVSPKIMGQATTTIFEGLMQKMNNIPGASIDFGAVGRIIITLIILYAVSAGFSYLMQRIMAGVSQRMAFDLRQQVNQKLSRLPLKFFDSRTHGEILSRVTNDVDHIASTLQQSITQSITSAVTFVGVIVMMLSISGWLTLITLITLPLAGLMTAQVAKRSQRHFKDQQAALGELNGHVEEMFTGHPVVKAFGREGVSVEQFGEINDDLYDAGWKAHFVSGLIMPLMGFVNNIGYLLVSVVGAIFVTRQAIAIGDIQAFI